MLMMILGLWLSHASYPQDFQPFFFSPYGEEMTVTFHAQYLTSFKTIEEMNESLPPDRSYYAAYHIEPTLKYLFGPLTRRGWGGIKKTLKIEVDWFHAEVTARGVILPYLYQGQWLLEIGFLNPPLQPIPVPYNGLVLISDLWQNCTDSHHNEQSFYWYYWDPTRPNCDHNEGKEYQSVTLELSTPTIETQRTYPEYERMTRSQEGKTVFPMTFAFGYYEEPYEPQPDSDTDVGAREYRKFLVEIRKLVPEKTKELLISRKDYPNFEGRNFTVGHRFLFKKGGLYFDIKVVMNAQIDQMILFARSYAQEHDGYFAWMGHSRVGSGFDAHRFAQIVKENPSTYSISSDYQVIYWGGCNSYSYYSEPFFKLKSEVVPNDPNGTRALDIIANGLPSYFGLNSANALIHFKTLINWKEERTSYQDLLLKMEQIASAFGTRVLAVVLGDEDNP